MEKKIVSCLISTSPRPADHTCMNRDLGSLWKSNLILSFNLFLKPCNKPLSVILCPKQSALVLCFQMCAFKTYVAVNMTIWKFLSEKSKVENTKSSSRKTIALALSERANCSQSRQG